MNATTHKEYVNTQFAIRIPEGVRVTIKLHKTIADDLYWVHYKDYGMCLAGPTIRECIGDKQYFALIMRGGDK